MTTHRAALRVSSYLCLSALSLEARHAASETHLIHSERPRGSDTGGPGGRPPPARPLDTEDHHGGERLDPCVAEVRRLESRRDGLVGELLRVHAPLLQAVARLRSQADEARRLLAPVQLGHAALCEDARRVKRKLFRAARGCVESRLTLAAQEYEVAQSSVTQEELKAQIQSLTQELSELQEAHRNRLSCLRDEATSKPSRRRARPLSDISHCRRASLSLQRRLSGSMTSLEGWYEPRLTALLRRRQAGEETLRKSKELGQELRARLGPLELDIQGLQLQRACLEERIALMEKERRESAAQSKRLQ
ncbi:hypothetical protein CRUP_019775 [Coryphaenoides rupestris]|nr:hypothetical protein CRUP_019775 [Coryphaenoides rupestris]